MERTKEPISVRIGKLNSQIIGKTKTFHHIFNREGLLDALQVLYDECDSDCLRNLDKNVANFVEENKKFITDVKEARVNLSDFELKNVIGRGHFGEVYMIKEKQTGDIYAMKIIKKHRSLEERNVAFNEERNIMAFSESLWITMLQYAFQDSANLYFVMEYHPGGDLLGLLYRQGGTLPESAASFYLAELIMAINDLHKMGYVHRDIKPDNVLLDRCGHIKLADFGSAAKLKNGSLCNPVPVGTPDYIAPEVLESMNGKSQKSTSYGMSCDYWSLGIVAYELVVGNTPFNGNNTATVYAKIMNHSQHLKFPTDIILSQGYVSLIRALITDYTNRLIYPKVMDHAVFKTVDFNSLRDQVPPYVPKISSIDDTSNFSDVQVKKNQPNIENFKKKTQFSGKNLPFIGFTFTQEINGYKERYPATNIRDSVVDNMKTEMDNLQKKLMKCNNWQQEKETLEKNLDNAKRNLNSVESVNYNLQKDIAKYSTEVSTLKRTLEIERKDRSELERRAVELIKSAKLKWEASEKLKLDAFNSELEQQKEQNNQLAEENRSLTEELKLHKQLENTHKVSLEKVEQINRKSVVGLETRLEKVTLDSKSQIANLEEELKRYRSEFKTLEDQLWILNTHKTELDKKLQSEQHKNHKLELDIAEFTTHNKQLKEQILIANHDLIALKNKNTHFDDKVCLLKKEVIELKHDKRAIENNLNKEKDYSSKLKREIEKLNLDVVNQKQKVDEVLQISTKTREENFTKLQEEIKIVKDRNTCLELKLEEAKQHDEENQLKVRSLEDLLNRLESGISKLENSSEREDILQDQIQRLEQQLMKVHELSALEKQEMLKTKTTLWRCQKDLTNSNLDKKIVERDLVEVRNDKKKLEEEIVNLKEQLTSIKKQDQDALVELSVMNETMANEILKLKELNNQLNNEMHSKSEKQAQDQVVIAQSKEMIQAKETCINDLKLQIDAIKKDKDLLLVIMEKKECEFNDVMCELNKVLEARKLDIIARENYKIDLEKANENLRDLKEACTILDNQLIEFEKLKIECDAKEATHNYKLEQLKLEIDQLKHKLSHAKKATNEEKSLKFMAESKHKRLLEEKESLENDLKLYISQRDEFKAYANSLSDELTSVEEKLAESETILVANERKIDNYLAENKMLKEENSSQLTHISNLKETIFNLNQSFSDLKRDHEVLMEKFQELENAYFDKVNYCAERELKLNSTIQQQTKLIDFLQLKVEEGQKKKKTLSDKLFGQSKKENIAPLSMNYKDLENELKKEKQTNNELREELYKLKNYSLPDCLKQNKLFKEDKKILEQIVQSPNTQKNELPRQKSLQRMRHKIPHRFESKISTRLSKCAYCDTQIYLGKSANICQECYIIVHSTCASLVPKTCGLPNAFAQHFSDSIRKTVTAPKEVVCTENSNVNVEGWVKILDQDTHSWEKRYACLTEYSFKIYASKPSDPSDLIEEIDILPNNGQAKIILEPSASEIDVPVASSDLTFILKVEIHFNSTCWPPQCLIFMTLTLDDKEKWFKALEAVLKQTQKYNGREVLQLKDNIDVNCVVDILDQTLLLGTDKGLFTYFKKSLVHINGFTSVHQISLIANLNMAIMIVNTNRIIIRCDLNHLKDVAQCAPCTNPSLTYSIISVNNLNGFHIFETSLQNKQLILGVATNKKVVLLIYDTSEHSFKPLRILDTAEPSSCLLFTEHSLIIGTDKFFEVDLITFEADELLDVSDEKLSHAIMCSKLGSFPLAIIRISKNPLEYLVCFKEFASFIDEYGRSSRESDLKWSQLPVAFHYHSSYLYVVTFISIEIIKITCDKDTCHQTIFKINHNNIRYLGNTKTGIYLKIGEEIKLIEAKTIDCDNISLSTNNDENQDDRFSFTSSMVNSLDGNLSDDECDFGSKTEMRKVKFTDL